MASFQNAYYVCNCPAEKCDRDCFSYRHMTHTESRADRIRSMTDEKLAEFIGGDPMHDICPNDCFENPDRPCKICVLKWLKQEANNEQFR